MDFESNSESEPYFQQVVAFAAEAGCFDFRLVLPSRLLYQADCFERMPPVSLGENTDRVRSLGGVRSSQRERILA